MIERTPRKTEMLISLVSNQKSEVLFELMQIEV